MTEHDIQKLHDDRYRCVGCGLETHDPDTIVHKECKPKITVLAGGGEIDKDGEVKVSPFSVFITYSQNPPNVADLQIGAKVAQEFYNLQNDENDLPECIESVTIKRSR